MTGSKSKAGASKSDSRLAVKKGAAGKKMTKAEKKAAKDPNMPKRPASAFFVFMEDFRKQYKEEHPKNKSVAAVGKAGGEKWKSMSDEEKAPFVAKAQQRKTEYEKNMKSYLKKKDEPDATEEEEEVAEDANSDKSKSEVHDDDDDDGSGEDSDED